MPSPVSERTYINQRQSSQLIGAVDGLAQATEYCHIDNPSTATTHETQLPRTRRKAYQNGPRVYISMIVSPFQKSLLTTIGVNRYSIFIGLVIVAALCVSAWLFAPKGETQM